MEEYQVKESYPEVIYWISVNNEDIPIIYKTLSHLLYETFSGLILEKVPPSYIHKIVYEPFVIKSMLKEEKE